jgi:mannose-1-phosphate guanylyltransferase
MEHAQNVIVADGAFEWDDLGSWTALGRHLKADPEGQLRRGRFHPCGCGAEHHL